MGTLSPQVVDYDNDGINDLVVGNYGDEVHLVRGLGKNDFAQPVKIKDKGGKVIRGEGERAEAIALPERYADYDSNLRKGLLEHSKKIKCQHPQFIDWDDDGDLDLLSVSGDRGQIALRLNEGSRDQVELSLEQKELNLPLSESEVVPCYKDWDNDGLLDIILLHLGAKDSVEWYRNIGEKGKPVFGEGKLLITIKGEKPKSVNRLDIEDYNGDGKLDIILGGGFIIPQSREDSGMWVYLQK